MRTNLIIGSLAALLLLPALPAQGASADEAALSKSATKLLMKFASFARSKKLGPMEKQAYGLIISDYDTDHTRSRKALSFKKVDGEWKFSPSKRRKKWEDKANRKGRYQVQQEWHTTCSKLGNEHRELGLAMTDDQGQLTDGGRRQLQQAILYNPLDKVAHEALGHVAWENNGITYFGTAEEVAFMKRMKEIETEALQIAQKEYEVKPVDQLPEVISKLGLEMYGATTENFTVYTRGTQQNADDVAVWGERALDFLEYVAGKGEARRAKNVMKSWAWFGYLWTGLEMDEFREANPGISQDAGNFANINFVEGNRNCTVVPRLTPAQMQDHIISYVFHYGLGGTQINNVGLCEGVHHAATWFLKSTCITKFGAEPKGTQTEAKLVLPEGANWWLREMRNQAIARTDLPLNVLPRTELAKFVPDARLKAWSFNVWAMARFPEKWVQFMRKCPHDKIPFPEEVEKACEEALKLPLEEVEAQWRDWASGRGVAAAATGYGPPLLPEFPNDDELEGLERLNQVRAAAACRQPPEAKKVEWTKGLPVCELDSEATAACKDHAVFLAQHKDHWTWPEAHEEDPAKEGFSPRGMRAGMRSVIVLSEGGNLDAKRSIDSWIGTVYHRFPLLEYNIKRFGLAHAAGPEGEVVVLDMGSLQEPRNDDWERNYSLCAWPPHGMKNVPRQFAFNELPNPLEDVGIGEEGQKNTGYPVSLQFTQLMMQNVSDASMKLYEAKKRGKNYENGDEVPCWLHTPNDPLLKRMVIRDVVFVIPKEVLKSNTTFKAVVNLTLSGRSEKVEWVFTTGSKMQGLGSLK